MDSRTATDRRLVPNRVITSLREQRGWGRGRLAKEFELVGRRHKLSTPEASAMEKQIYRLETGRTVRPSSIYADLYCFTFSRDAVELFGDLLPAQRTGERSLLRSHKFIPLYIGAASTERLGNKMQCHDAPDQWLQCRKFALTVSDARCTAYVWPFGVVLLHLEEDVEVESIAELAMWRRMTYPRNMAWARALIAELTGEVEPAAAYVLSAYWLHDPAWSGADLDTAARIMCIPRVLLDRSDDLSEDAAGSAALVERALMQDGFDHPELVDFSMKGISLGLASWSGVVYCPIARDRALLEHELVACELSVQAVWAYCDHLRRQVEAGTDPDVPREFGWRFLRGARSRLINERPQETSQHRTMREAIVETSGLRRHLDQAVEVLRECEGN